VLHDYWHCQRGSVLQSRNFRPELAIVDKFRNPVPLRKHARGREARLRGHLSAVSVLHPGLVAQSRTAGCLARRIFVALDFSQRFIL
jgi:hypothetical protein